MIEVELLPARSGAITARVNGTYLHSAFDPVREAERFVAQSIPESARTVVVIGPGLGHCFQALASRKVPPRTIGISLDRHISEMAVSQAHHQLVASDRQTLRENLIALLEDSDVPALAVASWEPSARLFYKETRSAETVVKEVVSRLQASLISQAALGRRWIRNTVHNLVHARTASLEQTDRRISACVVVGAGPTLEQSRNIIARHRKRLLVCATGSSLLPLRAVGVEPDLVVITDASPFASIHLRGLPHSCPVVAPYAATRAISQVEAMVPFSEGTEFEKMLLHAIGLPVVPPAGTVTASALRIVRALTGAPIYLAGVDLGWTETRSHARPHANTAFHAARSTRIEKPAAPIGSAAALFSIRVERAA